MPKVLERGLPVLGMCRGIQVLNVALGGTLVQHLAMTALERAPLRPRLVGLEGGRARLAAAGPPGAAPAPLDRRRADSNLRAALGATQAEVSSFHHQALDRVADDLEVVATAPDGVVEAVELADADVLAVQWELQEEWRVDQRFLRVFDWFVEAAADGR